MISKIRIASERYRDALKVCRDVFAAAGREYREPAGLGELLANARRLFTEQGDERAAIKEVDRARQWLNAIAAKFLRGGVEHYGGRINELRYMALERDIVENMEARLQDFEDLMRDETSSLVQRIDGFRALAQAVSNALPEQQRRIEHREQVAEEHASRKELERRQRRRQREEADALRQMQQQEAAEAEARQKREQTFDELFSA